MAEAFAELIPVGVPALIDNYIRIQTLCRRHGLNTLFDAVAEQLTGFLRDLNALAVQTAGMADGLIIKKILETAAPNRPRRVEMEKHIRSMPGPLGAVLVALLDDLNKIVNPLGEYGPYWRAQEYGTGTQQVPSQEGRVLFGTFEPGGLPPDAQQRGLGVGQDLYFMPQGRNPGWGTINYELPGRHFLRDGSTEAAAEWKARIEALSGKYAGGLKVLMQRLAAEVSGRGFIGRIEG